MLCKEKPRWIQSQAFANHFVKSICMTMLRLRPTIYLKRSHFCLANSLLWVGPTKNERSTRWGQSCWRTTNILDASACASSDKRQGHPTPRTHVDRVGRLVCAMGNDEAGDRTANDWDSVAVSCWYKMWSIIRNAFAISWRNVWHHVNEHLDTATSVMFW